MFLVLAKKPNGQGLSMLVDADTLQAWQLGYDGRRNREPGRGVQRMPGQQPYMVAQSSGCTAKSDGVACAAECARRFAALIQPVIFDKVTSDVLQIGSEI